MAVQGDLDDAHALREGMRGCAVIYHAAARVQGWGRFADFYHDNVAGTEQVLAAARATGVPRLIHVSTAAVLIGGPTIVEADETWPRPAQSLGLYPRSKALAEERVLAANTAGLTTIIMRPRFI